MREILFRGKTKTENEWVEGGIVPSFNGKHFYIGNMFVTHQIDLETVGQYTGLTDKNGKKIFEGDIVKYDILRNFNDLDLETAEEKQNCVGIVKFENGKFYPLPNIDYCEDSWYSVAYDNFEIIGNITDNPELLGGADNG